MLQYLRVLKLHKWLSFHEWEVLPMSKPNQQSCHSKSLGAWHYSPLLLWLSAAVWLIYHVERLLYERLYEYIYINICIHNFILLSLYYIVKMDWLLYFVDSVHIKTKQKLCNNEQWRKNVPCNLVYIFSLVEIKRCDFQKDLTENGDRGVLSHLCTFTTGPA